MKKFSILTELKLKLTTKIQQLLPSHLNSFHRLPTTRLVCMEMHTINPPRSPREQIIMHTPISIIPLLMGILLTPMYLSHLKPQLRKALLYPNKAPRTLML
jgi:hypothetical protein